MNEILDRCPVCGRATKMKLTREYLDEPWIVDCICDCEDQKNTDEQKHYRQESDRLHRSGYFHSILNDAKFRGYTFARDDGRNEKVSKYCRNYVMNFQQKLSKAKLKGVMLAGDTGIGKSFFAACIGHALESDGYSVLATTLPKLSGEIGLDQYNIRLQQLRQYQLLIIDDWGVERKTEYMDEFMQTVIDERYRQELPVIITTNRSIQDITYPKDPGDHRIISRLCDMVEVVPVKGQDRRIEGYQQRLRGT